MTTNHPAGPELRPARPEDAPEMARLWEDAFGGVLHRILGDSVRPFLEAFFEADPDILAGTVIGRIDGRPAGYIQVRTQAPPASGKVPVLWRLLRRHFGPFGSALRLVKLLITELGHEYAPDELYVYMLGVDAAHRNQGLGRRLLEHAEQEARNLGKATLKLGVVSENAPAVHLYEKFGFQRGPLVRSRLIGWVDGEGRYYMMTKKL